ncbi:hypothetical protein ANANG_G00049830 [Anguilla anguilla]|uniref:Uncharacterized protein n=1 Tax=Anguilla anguilla TaxID=7936 RepID=A0A9D3MWP4_ANGAN|nr:hypothetical protein ANANG_G00049830 [Anguilla anguilla]
MGGKHPTHQGKAGTNPAPILKKPAKKPACKKEISMQKKPGCKNNKKKVSMQIIIIKINKHPKKKGRMQKLRGARQDKGGTVKQPHQRAAKTGTYRVPKKDRRASGCPGRSTPKTTSE